MPRCQRHQLLGPGVEERVGGYEQCAGVQLAMIACAAKFCKRAICLSENGPKERSQVISR